MRCYAIAESIEGTPFSWHFSNLPFNLNNFYSPLSKNWHHEIITLCEAFQSGEETSFKPQNYPFVLNFKKVGTSACIILTDELLKKEELANLFSYLIDLDTHPSAIIASFGNHLKKDKLLEIHGQLMSTMTVMKDNLELLIQREESIESLVQKTDELVEQSLFLSFKIKPPKDNKPFFIKGLF